MKLSKICLGVVMATAAASAMADGHKKAGHMSMGNGSGNFQKLGLDYTYDSTPGQAMYDYAHQNSANDWNVGLNVRAGAGVGYRHIDVKDHGQPKLPNGHGEIAGVTADVGVGASYGTALLYMPDAVTAGSAVSKLQWGDKQRRSTSFSNLGKTVHVFKSFDNIGVWLSGGAPVGMYGTGSRLCLTSNNALRGSALCGGESVQAHFHNKVVEEFDGRHLVTGGGIGFFGNDFAVSGTVGTVGADQEGKLAQLFDAATQRQDGVQGTVDARFEMMHNVVVAGGYQYLAKPKGKREMLPAYNGKMNAFDLGMSYEISESLTLGVEGGYNREKFSLNDGALLDQITGSLTKGCLLNDIRLYCVSALAIQKLEKGLPNATTTTLNIAVPVAFSTQLGSLDVTLSGRPYWQRVKTAGTSGKLYGLGLGAQTWAFENTVLSGVQFNYAHSGKNYPHGKATAWDAAVNVQLFL